MADSHRQLLVDAVSRNCAVVVSLPTAGMLRHVKSRFVGEDAEALWVEATTDVFALADALIKSAAPVGVSFRNGPTKIVFAVPVLALQGEYAMNAQTLVPAIRLAVPEQVKAIQRRGNYRVRVLLDSGLSARVWRIAPRVSILEKPMPTAELTVSLRDLSIGGLGLIFIGQGGARPKIDPEDRLRVELQYADVTMILEARLRKSATVPEGEQWVTGIAFKETAGDLQGRQQTSQLTRIIGQMQREELRRTKLGLAS